MAKIDRGVVLLTLFIMLFSILLVILDESRPDAYLSVSILLYFIYTAIDSTIKRYVNTKFLDIGLVLIFIAIVAFRVIDILR